MADYDNNSQNNINEVGDTNTADYTPANDTADSNYLSETSNTDTAPADDTLVSSDKAGEAQRYQNPYYSNNGASSQASYTFSNDPSFGAVPTQKKKKKKKGSALFAIFAVILAVILISSCTCIGGALLSYVYILRGDITTSQTPISPSENNSPSQDTNNKAPITVNKVEGSSTQHTTMTEVIAAVRDSVVEIVTENIKESGFYGQYVTSGAGSGVIISENGYIITNNHVVDGAHNIYVRTTDDTEYKATLVGKDAESDIAVIKIEATGLSFATLGDSDAIKLGEEVIAIGNPLGSLGGTVTNGIISALNREITIDGQQMVLLQTNAAVNPGNSGGGLFNMAGELIGIVNAKSSSSSAETSIEGLGFAIPINHGFEVASQLIEFGYVKGKVTLTVSVTEYEQDYRYTQGFQTYIIKAGVYVTDPGKNTELKANDRFISVDGVTVSTLADIKSILKNHKVGDTITATVARVSGGKEYQQTVTLTCYEYIPDSTN